MSGFGGRGPISGPRNEGANILNEEIKHAQQEAAAKVKAEADRLESKRQQNVVREFGGNASRPAVRFASAERLRVKNEGQRRADERHARMQQAVGETKNAHTVEGILRDYGRLDDEAKNRVIQDAGLQREAIISGRIAKLNSEQLRQFNLGVHEDNKNTNKNKNDDGSQKKD